MSLRDSWGTEGRVVCSGLDFMQVLPRVLRPSGKITLTLGNSRYPI